MPIITRIPLPPTTVPLSTLLGGQLFKFIDDPTGIYMRVCPYNFAASTYLYSANLTTGLLVQNEDNPLVIKLTNEQVIIDCP